MLITQDLSPPHPSQWIVRQHVNSRKGTLGSTRAVATHIPTDAFSMRMVQHTWFHLSQYGRVLCVPLLEQLFMTCTFKQCFGRADVQAGCQGMPVTQLAGVATSEGPGKSDKQGALWLLRSPLVKLGVAEPRSHGGAVR
jgi:hypothetical protein